VNKNRYPNYWISLLYFSLFFIFCSTSCSKDPVREKTIEDPDTTVVTANYDDGIFIINEGNYNWGNASVTYLDNQTNKAVQSVFRKSNGRGLGDVAQSMKIIGNLGYVIVNNSNNIEVVSLKDFKSVKSITGLFYPRYMEVIDSNKAYVTNLLNYISVIDLQNNSVTGSLKTSTWTENLVLYEKHMLVTSVGDFSKPSSQRKAQIFKIDIQTDSIVDSLATGKEPVGIVIDKEKKVWILCSGGYDYFEAASLLRIDPISFRIEKVFTFFDTKQVPSRLCINHTMDTLYFLKGDVFQMPISAAGTPGQPLIPSEGRRFYGLEIHPVTGNIFVSDAKDYVQNGTAYQYDAKGTLIRQYISGRIPGTFCFTKVSDR